MVDNPIKDRVIRNNIQRFTDEWKVCSRVLQKYGYRESTMDTYHLAKRILVDGRKSVEEAEKNMKIDYKNLNTIVDLHKRKDLTYVAMHYPVLSDFKVFYYKERDRRVRNLVMEYYGQETWFSSVDELVDILDEVRDYVDVDSEIYENICDELVALEAVQDFMDVSDESSYAINKRIAMHIEAMKSELKRAKGRLIAEDYFRLENRRIKELEDLGDRVSMTINAMLNLHEN